MFKFIIPIFLIILSGGLFFSYIDPAYISMGGLKESQEEYNDALTKSKELREIRGELLGKYNTFSEKDIERLEKLLPDNIDNVRLIMEINHIAVRNGGMIRSVEVNSAVTNDTERGDLGLNLDEYESIGLSFTIEAEYDDFVNFINDLGDSLRVVDIISYSLKSGMENVYKHDVNIKTYWLK